MVALKRRLYQLLLRLHPADFRHRFARQMAFDFEDALATYGFARLFLDGTCSLARQWTAVPIFFSPMPAAAGSASLHPLLAGHYLEIRDKSLSPVELLRGSMLFVVLFFAVGLAFNAGGRHLIPAIQQSLSASHDGGLPVDSGHPYQPTTRAGALRQEAQPDYSQLLVIPTAEPYSQYRRQRYRNAHNARTRSLGLNPEARTIRIRVESWTEFLMRCGLVTGFVWLFSFLVRRTRFLSIRIALVALGLVAVTLSAAAASPPDPPATQLLHSDGPLPTFEVATVRLHSPSASLPPVPFSIDPVKAPGPPKIAPGRGGEQSATVFTSSCPRA